MELRQSIAEAWAEVLAGIVCARAALQHVVHLDSAGGITWLLSSAVVGCSSRSGAGGVTETIVRNRSGRPTTRPATSDSLNLRSGCLTARVDGHSLASKRRLARPVRLELVPDPGVGDVGDLGEQEQVIPAEALGRVPVALLIAIAPTERHGVVRAAVIPIRPDRGTHVPEPHGVDRLLLLLGVLRLDSVSPRIVGRQFLRRRQLLFSAA